MAEYQQEFSLWNGNKPFASELDMQRKEHFNPSEDGIRRLTDVTNPSVTFFPASGKGPHPAVLVCPGGGYEILAWNHEGLDTVRLLNLNGFSCFLLKYRCPGNQRAAAHADAARAMRFIRANAEEFNILKDKTGCIGFSAGAHLCATISAPAEEVPYPPVDVMDEEAYRPDFTALIYPAYLADDDLNLAPEFRITENTPSTFLLQAEDDGIRVENSLAWCLALKRAGVDCEMHIYAKGGHGYGSLRTGNPVQDWGTAAGAWFRRQAGVL